MNLLLPAVEATGFRKLFEPSERELRLLGFGLLSLRPKETWQVAFDAMEAALVILGGRCRLVAGEVIYAEVGEREDVFGGPAAMLYLPPGKPLHITALSGLEAALITSPAKSAGEAVLVRPAEVSVESVGTGSWRRSIHRLLDARVPAQRLLVGETFNEPGQWSSFPPHKHDRDIPGEEARLEELYHFRVSPAHGFGLQRIYSPANRIDEAYVVKDGDTVIIPEGYHPVAAAPGCNLYYLWALAGETREMRPREDPRYSQTAARPRELRPSNSEDKQDARAN